VQNPIMVVHGKDGESRAFYMQICEHVQRGLESKAYDRGRFSVECEVGVYNFQTLIKAAYRQALREARPH